MWSAKQATLERVREMPEEVSMRMILEELEFLAQIEEGLADADRGAVVSNDEILQELRGWQKSLGR